MLSVVVKLRHAEREFAAARARSGDGDDCFLRLDVVLVAIAALTKDEIEILGIIGDLIMYEDAESSVLEFLFEFLGDKFVVEAVDNDGRDVEASLAHVVYILKGLIIIGQPEVASDLTFLDILRADTENEFSFIAESPEHLDLCVHVEAWQNAGCMMVITQFTAKFEIEPVE